jgi:hypothetical protein
MLFLPPYVLWLVLVLLVVLAERALLGRADHAAPGVLQRTFSRACVFFLFALCALAGGTSDAVRRRLKTEGPVGVAIVAAAPFVAGAAAPIPAIVVSLPLAGLLRMRS